LENIRQNKNEKLKKTIFIKLTGRYGDSSISIYKIDKPNVLIQEIMSKFFIAHINNIINYLIDYKYHAACINGIPFGTNTEYKKLQLQSKTIKFLFPKNFEEMCKLIGLDIIVYSDINCIFNNIIQDIKDNIVFDMLYQKINLYKFIFNKIFNNKYSDMINYKIIENDGNFILTIFEFLNSYYVIYNYFS
jgi:hypothetical protein